jgi:DNA-binding XRE family transcriptional regulator
MAIQNLIKQNREAQKMSQEMLARRLGVTAKSISNHENGVHGDIGLRFAFGVASVFGKRVDEIFLQNDRSELLNPAPLEPEAQADLETAKREHQILVMNAVEDAQTELQQQPALERLAERLKIYGKRNQYGHKQLKNVVYSDGVLLEVFEDSDPEAISETRAAQILEVLA